VPSQLTAFLAKKHYLHATQLLVSALCLGEGSLEGVEALREVRTDLQSKKQVGSLCHLLQSVVDIC
jgi:exocyst complex component 4